MRAIPSDDAEPLDAELRRLHITVSKRLLEKVDRARDGLSHALPGASTEQVLERALGGETTVANLRCCCARHNRQAADEQLGPLARERRRRR